MSVGKGTKAGAELSGFVTDIEAVRDRKKQIGDQEKELFASAKAKGYDTKTIRRILKVRATDSKHYQESESLFDSYMHALGMAEELPLFRAVGMMGVDTAAAEQCIEALSLLVPAAGEIIVKIGGAQLRLYRDSEGEPHCEEVAEILPVLRRTRDPRYDDGEGPLPEGEVVAGPSSRSRRGLSKEAIAAAVARAEARAAESKGPAT
jgi:uncharacterized protein (UPF0335 family)